MLCGQILTRLKIRILVFLKWSFSNEMRPFEKHKCHACLWCKYVDECKCEYDLYKKNGGWHYIDFM